MVKLRHAQTNDYERQIFEITEGWIRKEENQWSFVSGHSKGPEAARKATPGETLIIKINFHQL